MHRWILQMGEDWYRCFEAKDGTFFIFQSATNTARPDECRLVSSGHRSAERALERLGSRLDGIRPRRQPVGGREVVGEVLWNEFWGKFGGPPQGSYDAPGRVLGMTGHGVPQIGLGHDHGAPERLIGRTIDGEPLVGVRNSRGGIEWQRACDPQIVVGMRLRNHEGHVSEIKRVLDSSTYPDGIMRFEVWHYYSTHLGVWRLPDILDDLKSGQLTIVTEP